MINIEGVKRNAVEYFGDELTANVWFDKYCMKDAHEIYETYPEDTIVRLSKEVSRIENAYPNPMSYDEIYNLMSGYEKFVLAGSPLFGIGNNHTLSTLGNCFVVDSPVDSYGGILKTDQEIAQIMKRRGGVGLDISSLRPKRSPVSNAANTSTGAVSFMHRYSETTREVAQEGRRGALMLSIGIKHPDSPHFIMAKDDLTKITGANISVRVSDEFMEAVEKDGMFEFEFEGKSYGSVKAILLWHKLIHQAWKNAEPGILFWDRITQNSPADCYPGFKTISTNPCSELPLCAYDSCRISAINIYAYVMYPFSDKASFDYNQLAVDAKKAQRIMDDVIDLEAEKIEAIIAKVSNDPEPLSVRATELELWSKIQEKLLTGRRTGLGQMGLADAGAALGLKYGSSEFIEWAEEVNRTIALASYVSSIEMAEERGAFPVYDRSLEVDNPYIQNILKGLSRDYIAKYFMYGRRNIANLTIAPTGSISMLAGVSSGIEPVFALSYSRKRKVTEDNPNKSYRDKQGDWWETYEVLHPQYALTKSKAYEGATAHEINPETKLLLQSVIQPWIDHSISITYNLPESATESEVSALYFSAWAMGLKGLTIYRDGCRDGILSTHKKVEFIQHDAPKRPKSLKCNIHNVKSKGIDWTVSIGLLEDKPYEVFAAEHTKLAGKGIMSGYMIKQSKGRYDLLVDGDGKFDNITSECPDEQNLLTRMISTSLRHGADMKFIVDQLDKSTGDITSFGKAISRVLKRYIPEGSKASSLCDKCGSVLVYEGGCAICKECGDSKCS